MIKRCYGVPAGSKVFIYRRTKNNIRGTIFIFRPTIINYRGTKNKYRRTHIYFSSDDN